MTVPTERQWFREPLLHFLLIAVAIFAVDYATGGGRDTRRVVLVDDALRGQLTAMFDEGQGRPPSAQELDQLVYRWVQNEVIYREALALGLDKGDDMIRERLVTKMRTVLLENVVVDKPPADELERWFADNRQFYDLPATFDVAQFAVPGGADAEARARALAAAAGSRPVTGPEADAVRTYQARSEANVADMFGAEFAAALAAAPVGQWQALPSNAGWHVARVTAATPALPAALADVRGQAEVEWRAVQARRQMAEALTAIRDRYEVRVVPPAASTRLAEAR